MSIGGTILTALQARLETITTAAGYTNNVKSVHLNYSEPTLNTSAVDLPLIEIINDSETYEHNAGSSYWADTVVSLYIVAEKSFTDIQMEDLLSDIRKALYGGTSDATGNSGMRLGGAVDSLHLLDTHTDLNMIETNRAWLMRIKLRTHRTTYRD